MLQGSRLCPAVALDRVFREIRLSSSAHLFAFSDGTSLTYSMFQERLRSALVGAKVNSPHLFSSHSYRRGGTMFSFLCGVPLELIKVLGNWKSNAFLRYLEFPLETRLAASELMKLKILHRNYHY